MLAHDNYAWSKVLLRGPMARPQAPPIPLPVTWNAFVPWKRGLRRLLPVPNGAICAKIRICSSHFGNYA